MLLSLNFKFWDLTPQGQLWTPLDSHLWLIIIFCSLSSNFAIMTVVKLTMWGISTVDVDLVISRFKFDTVWLPFMTYYKVRFIFKQLCHHNNHKSNDVKWESSQVDPMVSSYVPQGEFSRSSWLGPGVERCCVVQRPSPVDCPLACPHGINCTTASNADNSVIMIKAYPVTIGCLVPGNGYHFTKNYIALSKIAINSIPCLRDSSDSVATKFWTCHDSGAVVTCATCVVVRSHWFEQSLINTKIIPIYVHNLSLSWDAPLDVESPMGEYRRKTRVEGAVCMLLLQPLIQLHIHLERWNFFNNKFVYNCDQ